MLQILQKGTKIISYERDLCDYLRQRVEEGLVIPRLAVLGVCQEHWSIEYS